MSKHGRREFVGLAAGAGLAVLVPGGLKTVQGRLEHDRVRRAIEPLAELFLGSPVMASGAVPVSPSDDIRHVAPVTAAWQKMIGEAEGTFARGIPSYDPYRVLCGSTQSNPRLIPPDDKCWSQHPGFRARAGEAGFSGYPYRWVDRSGQRWSSDAAGYGQWLRTTWYPHRHERGYTYHDGLGDFAPENQDLAMLYYQAANTKSHWSLRSAIGEKDGRLIVDWSKWTAARHADSGTWASLNGQDIGASSGQSTKADWQLASFFLSGLWDSLGFNRNIDQIIPEGTITSKMGYRKHPKSGEWKLHTGLDIAAPMGKPIIAPEDGSAWSGGEQGGYGNTVYFSPHRDPNLRVMVAHCQAVSVGDMVAVKRGQQIAAVGSTGYSTGPHGHIEAWWCDMRFDPRRYQGMAEWY